MKSYMTREIQNIHFYRLLKEDFEMKEKVVLAYSGGLDEIGRAHV